MSRIIPIPTGRIDGRSYVVVADDGEAFVIDPDINVNSIMDALEAEGGRLKYILLTHCHFDHVSGAEDLQSRTGALIAMHRIDALSVNVQSINMTAAFRQPPITDLEVGMTLDDGDVFTVGELTIKVIHTPGHTAGGCSYLMDGDLFTGDTLFRGTFGMTDCPDSSFEMLKDSINRLFELDGGITIWPGHGHKSTIERERRLNLINR